MSFFICKAKFLCHLCRKRTWVSKIAADEETGAQSLQSGKEKREKNLSYFDFVFYKLLPAPGS